MLWLGTAERISAIVEMNHPGMWVMGDLADDDRSHGMGVVVEYAGQKGKPVWTRRSRSTGTTRASESRSAAAPPDETFEMTFAKDNAARKVSTAGRSMALRSR